jgi:hypothetical protein
LILSISDIRLLRFDDEQINMTYLAEQTSGILYSPLLLGHRGVSPLSKRIEQPAGLERGPVRGRLS